ncbi:MAG: FAD-dependent oxidoreductase [Methylococcaceae bacterium]|nr:FAD-dependent oxidoreductase [Methylococcaceae bacterium]MCI0666634.1 FAD-dependent oxidoreductase [Methylococcaceae bacterium]MCI0733381.1 FAD-dependent oxidoreductase [Methylococcaceae bacterium]
MNQEFLRAAIRINTKLLALVFGLTSGLLLFTATIVSVVLRALHPGHYEFLNLLGVFLPGYDVSVTGAFLGFFWGAVIGALFGSLIYWAYARTLREKIASYFALEDPDNLLQGPQTLKIEGHYLGVATGLGSALLLFLSTNTLVIRGTAQFSVNAALLSNYLPGYQVSFVGSLIGSAELFVLVYLITILFGFTYNKVVALRNRDIPSLFDYEPARPKPIPLKPADHVCILGAGPAGLATGHELSLNGTKVTVLEKNSYVGGLCRTVHSKGYKFDLGGHRWFTQNESLNNWFRRLMEGEIILVNRISRIYYDGKYFNYPITFGDVIKNTGIFTMLWAGITYIQSFIVFNVLNRPVKNMKDAYTQQFGSKLYEMFFKIYTEKVWGLPCEQLSADWVTQRSKGLNILTVIREALVKSRNVVSLVEEFMYPRDGYVRIPERMAEDIVGAGNEVLLNSGVKKIIYKGTRDFEIVYRSQDGTERSVHADSVVSTIPMGILAQIIEPACEEKVLKAAKSMEFRDLITVNLMLKKKQVSTDTWLYLQDKNLIFGRLHEPKNWSPAMVPDEAHTSVVLEVFCTINDPLWSLSDDEIAIRCVDDLADKLGFIERHEVEGWTVIRTGHAYPVYDLDYHNKVSIVTEFLGRFEGLHIAGRGGTFRYNNADHSIEMGLMLGRKILGQPVDHMQVNTEHTYHEEKSLEGPKRDHYGQSAVG